MDSLSVNGAAIRYDDSGPTGGVPVVLVHGHPIVVGADDTYTPVRDAEFMHRQVPGSTLVVIDGAAHMPNLERPEAFNAALLRFLDAHG